MTTGVKICGITTLPALEAALETGADYVGLVFFPPSPRYLERPAARRLADRARGRALSVALVVDADDALIDAIAREVAPDMLQLHGKESLERVTEVRRRTGCKVIKAVSVASRADAEAGSRYRDAADLVLYDAKPPPGGPLPGGNGVAFDWHHLETVRHLHPFMLSGGLTAANVRAAVELTGADIVDVSSGVERAPGDKDPDLVRGFIAAAKRNS